MALSSWVFTAETAAREATLVTRQKPKPKWSLRHNKKGKLVAEPARIRGEDVQLRLGQGRTRDIVESLTVRREI